MYSTCFTGLPAMEFYLLTCRHDASEICCGQAVNGNMDISKQEGLRNFTNKDRMDIIFLNADGISGWFY